MRKGRIYTNSILAVVVLVGLVLISPAAGPASAQTGTANLALNRPVVASSVERWDLGMGNAVDGDPGTRWSSRQRVDPQWIYVDLGQVHSIQQVVLRWQTAFAESYRIEFSNDAANWSTVSFQEARNGGVDVIPVSGAARYVRMFGITRGNSGFGYSLYEFEVYDQPAFEVPPSQVRPSDPVPGPNTLFFDDFEGAVPDPAWNFVSGNWPVIDGVLETTDLCGGGFSAARVGDASWTDYEVQFDFRGMAGSGKSFVFRWDDSTGDTYVWSARSLEDDMVLQGSGQPTSFASFPFQNGVWYRVRIRAEGERVQVYVDDQLLLDRIDAGTQRLSGSVGPYVNSGTVNCPFRVQYDNVIVTGLDLAPTPVVDLPYHITDAIPGRPTTPGETFFTQRFALDYQGGSIILSGTADGTGDTIVDDAVEITVMHPDGTVATLDHSYQSACASLNPMAPLDISYLFAPGRNTVTVRLYDICGVNAFSSALYLFMPFAEYAAGLAKSVVDAPYVGRKGYEYDDVNLFYQFDGPEQIRQKGLDCSGLAFWSYNRTHFGDRELTEQQWDDRPLYWFGADGQYRAYRADVSSEELKPGDLLFFDAYADSHYGWGASKTKPYEGYAVTGQDGHIDHVAMYVGPFVDDSQEYNVIEATGYTLSVSPTTVDLIIARIAALSGDDSFVGFGRVRDAPVPMTLVAECPIDLIVTDPDGIVLTKSMKDTIGMSYMEYDVNGDGDSDDIVAVAERKVGDYAIDVVTEPGAVGTDTYTLKVRIPGEVIVLAQDVLVGDIPSQGYIVRFTGSEISAFIPVSVDVGPDAVLTEGDALYRSGSFSDPDGHNWIATVDYGDGAGPQPSSLLGALFDLSHSYSDNGIYTVTVTVCDDGGDCGEDQFTVTVENVVPDVDTVGVDPEPSVEGSPVIASATFTDPGFDDTPFTCWVDYGDGSGSQAGTVSEHTCTGPAHIYADNGSYQVTISVRDKDGGVGNSVTTHVVDNAPPEVTIIAPAAFSIYPVGASVAFEGAFTDVGSEDTHTAEWTLDSATIEQPMVLDGMVNQDDDTASLVTSFAVPGIYHIALVIEDDDGGVGTATTIGNGLEATIIVYDPEGGFVTGGGWINSPEGAYAPDPLLTGKASFGFVSKYKKGADVPIGQTEFQFKVADLNFHSESYQWLVIAGPKAQFKGTGTINGEGNYGFMLTAVDADLTPSTDVDLFRIKIWDKDNGDAIVYDNQIGNADDADPATAIGGGSIVIHKK